MGRRRTKLIKIGNVKIGGNNPIVVQSMAKNKTSRIARVVREIEELENEGCEIVRLAIKDRLDVKALTTIKRQTPLSLVADIHFDWRLAMEAINNGADKIRLNPGNIYKKDEVCRIAKAAQQRHIPIRVGLNSGSLPKKNRSIFIESNGNVAKLMAQSALNYIKLLEDSGFDDIVVSLKASNIFDTMGAYRRLAPLCDYPFHLGVTATGLPCAGMIKSTIAISALLLEGIGDTIRISLTDKPHEEVRVAKYILEALGLRSFGPEIISCPTCGRCEVDLISIVRKLENLLSYRPLGLSACQPVSRLERQSGKPIKVAVMGCVVNGPGEAREADIGIAFGKNEGLLFKKGKAVKKVSVDNCIDVLLKEML